MKLPARRTYVPAVTIATTDSAFPVGVEEEEATLPTYVPVVTIATTDSAFAVGVEEEEDDEEEAYLEGIEKLVQDLSSSDNVTVNAALDSRRGVSGSRQGYRKA